jgi:serine/threonine protein kinase
MIPVKYIKSVKELPIKDVLSPKVIKKYNNMGLKLNKELSIVANDTIIIKYFSKYSREDLYKYIKEHNVYITHDQIIEKVIIIATDIIILEILQTVSLFIQMVLISLQSDPMTLHYIYQQTPMDMLVFYKDEKYKEILDMEDIKKCTKNLIIKNRIGQGSYGYIDRVCMGDYGCDYAIKTQSFIDDTHYDHHSQTIFWNEIATMNRLNCIDPSFAPIIYAAWECIQDGVRYGVYLMEKMDGSLDNFDPEIPKEKIILDKYVKKTIKLLKKLSKEYIIHGDLKLANVLYKGKNIKLGDWGMSKTFLNTGFHMVNRRYFSYYTYENKSTTFYNSIIRFDPYYDLSLFGYSCLYFDIYSIFPVEEASLFLEGPLYEIFKNNIKYQHKKKQRNDWKDHLGGKKVNRKGIYDLLSVAIFRST